MDNVLLPRLRKAFHDAFGVDPLSITLDTRPGEVPGWDSLGHLTLASSLEREFDISLDVDELMAMENVREILRIVESRLSRRA
ncbi:MAG: acyl carrier protein [Candidatus Dormibacteraeota bacterium]|nr:acyl carrier protein [Candidatus Dormibacteraeota bacterium]